MTTVKRRFSEQPKFDRAKMRSVIHYVCSRCEPERLGAVKLHKVLYYSDMIRYAHTGAPITGATYRKRKYGPTADALLPILREMEKEGIIQIGDMDYYGFKKKLFHSKTQFDASELTNSEIALLNEVVEFVCYNNTAKTISEFSHNLAWESVGPGEAIPYASAFLLYPTPVSERSYEWAEQVVEEIESQESTGTSLGYRSIGAFRESFRKA